jgi:single-stranded-DNA-specific exonuclease
LLQLTLVGVNRNIVKEGLEYLKKSKRLGILALSEISGINLADISVYGIGFGLAPRINAMGRLEHAMDSLRLICTTDLRRSKSLAQTLDDTNNKRRTEVENAYLKAVSKVNSHDNILVSYSQEYHEGIFGLVASNLVEKYYRPAIVFAVDEKIAKASARSIEGFNIIEAIRELDELIIEGGGHPMAAGFSIYKKNLKIFGKRINELAQEKITEEMLMKTLKIDIFLHFNQINWELVKKINQFNPFGIGNPTPLFLTKEVEVVNSKLVGSEKKHVKLKLKEGGREYDAIAFGMADKFSKNKSRIDIVYNLAINTWQGVDSIQLTVRDIK